MTDERRWHIPEERDRLSKKEWLALFYAQDGKCAHKGCGQKLHLKGSTEVEVETAPAIDEHVRPLSMLGSNKRSNRQLWCVGCATDKTSVEAPIRAKSNRVRDKFIGAPKPKSKRKSYFPGGKDDPRGLKKSPSGKITDRRTGEVIRD